MTFADLFDKGGPVVYILAGYSVLALAILLERYVQFLRMGRLPRDFEGQLHSHTHHQALEAFLAQQSGPEVAVVQAIDQARQSGVTDLGRVASRAQAQELRRMERGLPTLALLGNTAPLLGLFGTITGMIKAFMVIEQAGGKVDAAALAGGIWEAMVTTGVGLAVAIPVLFFLHLLEGMTETRAHTMQRCASILLERLPAGPVPAPEEHVQHWERVADGL